MKATSLKKIMTSFLVLAMLCTSSLGTFSNIGTVLLGATDAPEVAPDSSVSSGVITDAPVDPVVEEQVIAADTTEPVISSDIVDAAVDAATGDVVADPTISQTTIAPESPSTLEVTPAATCVEPTDVDDPQFTNDEITLYMGEGFPIEAFYNPEGTPDEVIIDEEGNEEVLEGIPPAATDSDPNVTYEYILGDFKNDGTDAPGSYTVYLKATDSSCNTTGTDDGVGTNYENQAININVLEYPTVYAAQDNFSTKVNLEFVYDRSLYPDYAEAQLLVFDEDLNEVDSLMLDFNATTYTYDQGNYEDYTYFYFVNVGTEEFIYGYAEAVMIQLPTINSLSASVSDDSKTININYDISLNDFPGAIAYIEVNGERVATLDPNKTSITYAAPGYGTYDIKLVLDYSESADPLTKSTTVEIKTPTNLAYTGLDTSVFENFILFLQDFITNIFK